ncbi:sensor domain-containing diguanylate cyclase [Peristeroidobacter agariperforans]|uniref:sensor domain-containing diguanylate cyclase n=1 Tax=Peristeroidobacter agariperforans TaxID=268404 RepID=UPI00101BAA3C|nr:GGDEF domain-containing protein [Peristeroidobacter agariperforans]
MSPAPAEQAPIRNDSVRHWLLGGIACLCLFAGGPLLAADGEDFAAMLQRADAVKTVDPAEFTRLIDQLHAQLDNLSGQQREHLQYLQGWRLAYAGEYAAAIPMLESLADKASDPTIQFRASVTATNVQMLATRYEGAFLQLNKLLNKLPEVTDKDARLQGMSVAADLYVLVGEYDLGIHYAERVAEENARGRGICRGEQIRLDALCKTKRITADDPALPAAIDACLRQGESMAANGIRSTQARLFLRENRVDEAINLLERYYSEVEQTRYPRGISEWESLMAQAYQRRGAGVNAQRMALRAAEHSVKNQFTLPLVGAYRVLYEETEKQGDISSAIAYLKKSAAADKAYLDDVTARQLAYERVKSNTLSTKSQLEALNQENKLLQLQRELDGKAAETSRLYIALLLLVLVFIALWAYRTKRSQLHFMKLSQVDSLTGIANRPRFIQLAEAVLEAARKSQQQASVVLCDLDHFKSINDRFGHAAGDHVLRQAVLACQGHLRVSDIFGRVGGEEFGIVLPGCGLEDAIQRAERLRIALNAIEPQYDGERCLVSGSFGVTSTEQSGYELRQLLAHADAALYRAKDAGRDRVMPYDGKTVDAARPDPVDDNELRNVGHA